MHGQQASRLFAQTTGVPSVAVVASRLVSALEAIPRRVIVWGERDCEATTHNVAHHRVEDEETRLDEACKINTSIT